jgi:hypothetical protein
MPTICTNMAVLSFTVSFALAYHNLSVIPQMALNMSCNQLRVFEWTERETSMTSTTK